MLKTRLPLVMLLGLAALALLSGCAGTVPTPAQAMREAEGQVPGGVVLTAEDLTATPTPTPTPEPTATPTPTPTPTPEATPTPEIVWTTEEIFEVLGVYPELLQQYDFLQYALPITQVDIAPQGKTPEEIAQNLLAIQGQWDHEVKNYPRDQYNHFFSHWLTDIMLSVGSPAYTQALYDAGKVTDENKDVAAALQRAILKAFREANPANFQPQYLLQPDYLADKYDKAGFLPAMTGMLQLMQQFSGTPIDSALIIARPMGMDDNRPQVRADWIGKYIWQYAKGQISYIGENTGGMIRPPMKFTAADGSVLEGVPAGVEGHRVPSSGEIVEMLVISPNGLIGQVWIKGEGDILHRETQVIGGQVLDQHGQVLFSFGEQPPDEFFLPDDPALILTGK